MRWFVFAFLSLFILAGCSDSSDSPEPTPPTPPPTLDFSQADAWMSEFVATEQLFNGGSYIVVDRESGVVHKAVFGDQTEDSLVLLASTSKVPTVTLLMALHDDENLDFDISNPIAQYLPWQGVWDENIAAENLVSNRSGIPGLGQILSTINGVGGAHACQFLPLGTLYACAETLYTTPLPGLQSTPADTNFDYGGSQWQIAGAVAETVGGTGWNQLWDQYIGAPCELTQSTYGNNLSFAAEWDGNAESLQGLDNPNMEGGMMATLDDYAKLLAMHLNEGMCGDTRVLSADSVTYMRRMTTEFPPDSAFGGYAMGWWLEPAGDDGEITLFTDGGAWGSLSWIDTKRGIAGVVFFEEYTQQEASKGSGGARAELIPLIQAAFDAVR